jgi:predicted nucleic acid-binding Zn ribbon protein
MKNGTLRFLLVNVLAVLFIISCASKPNPAEPASNKPVTAGPATAAPQGQESTPATPQGPGQDLLDELNAAMARAQSGREKAAAVQGQVYFPDEWNKAEADNGAGKNVNKGTEEGVKQGIALFTSAAEGYESIAGKAGPLLAKEQEDANAALRAAIARADKSRKDAQDNQGPKYFPNDWANAETEYKNGVNAKKGTVEEIKAAAALYNSAADDYDAIAGKSKLALAKDKEEADKAAAEKALQTAREEADKALKAAMARAEKSRQAAISVNGQTYLPNDWRNAETKNTSAKNAKTTNVDEIKAATALFNSAADAYDDIAKKSQQMIAKEKEDADKAKQAAKEKEDADKALQAAIARAEKSRQTAISVDGQTYLPNDWRNAETKNTSAKNAKTTNVNEIKAATALFNSAAAAYDDITKKTQQMIAKEKDDADKALRAAIARAEKSRKDAQDAKGNVNFPDDWKNAEAKNSTAGGAKRSTVAEIKAAVPLYNSAADAYDDIIKKNTAFLNAQVQKSADDAKARAEQERQKALDVKANVAAAKEFGDADAVFQQASKDFNGKGFASAAERYNKAADQFIAAALLAEKKRTLAEETIGEAKNKSEQSAVFAANTGHAIGEREELLNNKHMHENLKLIGLAEHAYAEAKYDDAVKYAQEAMKNAGLSDEYAALQKKKKEAHDAIAAAQARLDQIKKLNAHIKHAEDYEKAEKAFAQAHDFRSKEEWDKAIEAALAVVAHLSHISSTPVLAAQYRVKTWEGEKDCLWNIAGRKEIYGDPHRWRVIYNANRHKLPSPHNPHVVEPGTLLDIPSIAGEYRAGILED